MSLNIAQLQAFLEDLNPTTELGYEDPNFTGEGLLENFPADAFTYDPDTQMLLVRIPCVGAIE